MDKGDLTMYLRPEEISRILEEKIRGFEARLSRDEVGTVIQVGDGIALVYGLEEVMAGEVVVFENGVKGTVLNLDQHHVGVVILGEFKDIREGESVRRTGEVLSVPCSSSLLGRVVNPIGEPIDGKGRLEADKWYPIEREAPRIIERDFVRTPLETGIKAIDALVPIGRGQRELIVGDRQTGKTSLAIDTIIHQKGKDVICIYVAIGQKASSIASIVQELEQEGAMAYTLVVAATASDPAPLLYISPYSGCAMGEYFMDQGKDVLIIYDDLTKHAVAYREISLLLKRPPGREAYPGDVFYLHSRLLERASKVEAALGGGSITALPIVETQAGDISSYIPTNVISITDGQIFLETDLFNEGVRPAINPGVSVSRVGGNAQFPALKQVAASLRIDLAQYRELEAFSQFSTDLDPETQKKLTRGQRLVEILVQPNYAPIGVEDQVISLYAANLGIFDTISLNRVRELEKGIIAYVRKDQEEILKKIRKREKLSKEDFQSLQRTIFRYMESIEEA